MRDVRLDYQLGTHYTRTRSDECNLIPQVPRRLYERVHFGVDAPTLSCLVRVALVRESTHVTVVSDRDHVFEARVGYDRTDPKSGAGRPLCEFLGHTHVDLKEWRTAHRFQRHIRDILRPILDRIAPVLLDHI